MSDSEKKIRAFIRPGKAVRIVLWCAFALTAVLTAVGFVFKLNKNLAVSVKFDAMNSPKETYSYIDVVAMSDWLYEYTYNDNKETFYVVMDTDGYWSFAAVSSKDLSHLRAQRMYWDGLTETAPEPYRIYGEAWPLNASSRTWSELYKLSGVTSAEEFENQFGQMYLLGGYNPYSEIGGGFHLGAIFIGLFAVITLLCVSPKMIKTGKSIRALKKEGQLEAAAAELETVTPIGPCVIGDGFLTVSRQGVAIPVGDIKSCAGFSQAVRLKTGILGEVVIPDLKPDIAQAVFDALPIEAETVEVVRVKSK